MIHVYTSSRYKVNKQKIINHAETFLRVRHYQLNGFINIVFVGQRKMKQVAREYLDVDIAKPVLTFRLDEDETFGEIYMCYPQVVLLAAEKNKTVSHMISDLVEHGIDNLFKKK